MSNSAFTPGDFVVYRVGTGASLTGNATSVFLDEYTTSGSLVQSITIPAQGSAALTASGTSTSEGQMTLSPDGSTIALTGYTVPAGGATQGTDNGTVAIIGASAIPTYYVLPNASVVNGNNIRSTTVDGNKLYIAGTATYIQYTSISSLTAGGTVNAATTKLNSNVKNVEELQIVKGQLYFSTEKQGSSGYNISGDSIASIGTGEPTTTATPAGIADSSTNSSSFFFEHLGGGTGAPNTLYVADTVSGVEKYSLVGSTWTAEGTAAISGGAYGITGSVDGNGYVHIYATNAAGIFNLTDTSGQTGTLAAGVSEIVTALSGTAIDGIVLAPDDGVGAITGLGTSAGYIQGRPAIDPTSAAGFADASNFDGGKLVISGGLANDTLGIASNANITTSGNAISYGGVQIGTYAGGSGITPLTITFNNVNGIAVTSAQVQGLIDQIAFSSTIAGAVGNRTLFFQVTENSGAADAAATETISVAAPAMNAPLISAPGTLNISENAGSQSVNLTGIQHNGGSGAITVTAISDNPSLIPNTGTGGVAVIYTSPGLTGALTFTPTAGVVGTAHLIMTAADSAGLAIAIETVNVIGPPGNTWPGAMNVVENSPLAFSTASGNPLSIADFAVGSSSIQLVLSVSHGTITLGSTSGLTFITNGIGQGNFTVDGTLANINAALNGMVYTPTSGFTGADSLQVVSSDLGHTALGYVQSTISTVRLTVISPPAVLLNEIEANEPGTDDNRYQYVELSGTPGASLNNLYFVAFGGTGDTVGEADYVCPLAGYSIGSDGLAVIQSSAAAGHTIPSATSVVPDSNYFTITGGFPDNTLSFFLFDSPNGTFTQGADYDTNADGVLDHLPPGAASLDNVAIPNTGNPNDVVYGDVEVTEIQSLNTGTADAITRFPGITVTASGAWYGGELIDTNNVDSQVDYDPNRESVNEPANAYLTPGAVNYPVPPVYNPTSYSFGAAKSAAPGTLVGTVAATAGGTDTLTYSLSGTGSSNFTINASTGTINVASAAFPSGTYKFIATATDNQDGDSTTATVSVALTATSTAVTSSSSPAGYGQSVTFTATVTPSSSNGETGTVQFFIDGAYAGSVAALSGNTATYTTSTLTPGTHSITAVYSGDSNFAASTSPALSQTVIAAVLALTGPAFYLRLDSDGKHLDIWNTAAATGAYTQQVLLSNLQSVSVSGNSGADLLTVDFFAGDPLPAGGLSDTGGGNGAGDVLRIIGSSGSDSITASAGQIIIDGGILNSTNVGQTIFTPGAGGDSLLVNSGTLVLAPPSTASGITAMTFSSITLMAGSRLMVQTPVTAATRSVVVASNLVLSESAGSWTSTLDLASNDLIVRGGSLPAITAGIASGLYAGGGYGITSSAAFTNATHLTTLGAIQNSVDGTTTGTALYGNGSGFDGINTLSTDVLAKYTYYGDTNLDGKVDGSDYSLLDSGYLNHATGWYNGDLNYDGHIDGTDYAPMDNAFNTQGARIESEIGDLVETAVTSIDKMKLATVSASVFSARSLAVADLLPGTSESLSLEQQLLHGDVLDRLAIAFR